MRHLLLLLAITSLSGCFLAANYPGQYIDADQDDVFSDQDCDDNDPTRFPGNPELCNGLDEDCDELIDEDFDADGDGVTLCGPDGDLATVADNDCDDDDVLDFPGGTETCNGDDEDCDGLVDSGFDADGDQVTTCGADGEPGTADDDCADEDSSVYPGASEACNAADDDCDGEVDDGLDIDGDGFTPCGPDGVAGNADDDCDDTDALDFPGGIETCNADDEDCDGVPDDGLDADSDTFTPCGADGIAGNEDDDCDDSDPLDNPNGVETCNADDEDCDGVVDNGFDGDADGVTTCGPDGDPSATGDNDCDDTDASDFPGATELCNADDEDCDGVLDNGYDLDGDGFTVCGADGDVTATADNDCDDADILDNPNGIETCNGDDENCDGVADDGLDGDADGVTPCGPDGVPGNADDDCDDGASTTFPGATEVCNAVDDDCDGTPDDGLDGDGDGVTPCGPDGIAGNADDDCDDSDGTVSPLEAEICDALDQDCDTVADDGLDGDGDGVTPCGPDGIVGNADDDCDDAVDTTFPGATEVCDGVDNDCDSTADDGLDGDTDTVTPCGPDGTFGTPDDDCDDADEDTWPGATELCDGIDNDCSGHPDAVATGDSFEGYSLQHSEDSWATVVYNPGPNPFSRCGTGSAGSHFTVQPDAPFSFEFFGQVANDWAWWSQGFVNMHGPWVATGPYFLPAPSQPNAIVAWWLANLDAGGLQTCWWSTGPIGSQIFHYEAQATYPNSAVLVHVQVQFHETDGAIEIHYIDAPPPPSGLVSVGIESTDGQYAVSHANLSTTLTETGNALRFEPALETEYDYDNDGQLACEECDDLDPTAFVGNTEICGDGIDNDCNGQIDDNCAQ